MAGQGKTRLVAAPWRVVACRGCAVLVAPRNIIWHRLYPLRHGRVLLIAWHGLYDDVPAAPFCAGRRAPILIDICISAPLRPRPC